MSDYISNEALLEELNCYEKELYKDKRDAIDTEDEMMLFAIQNQETAISRITRSIMHSLPTLDEKEIIRKTVERIVERLEQQEKQYNERAKKFAEALHSWEERRNYGKACSYAHAIEIVKEECGINE